MAKCEHGTFQAVKNCQHVMRQGISFGVCAYECLRASFPISIFGQNRHEFKIITGQGVLQFKKCSFSFIVSISKCNDANEQKPIECVFSFNIK